MNYSKFHCVLLSLISWTTQGAILGLRIEWMCDLDRSYDNCKPKYSARRLDDRNAKLSPGFNFRYSHKFTSNLSTYSITSPNRYANTWIDANGTYRRQLIKAYGIRVYVNVVGEVCLTIPVVYFSLMLLLLMAGW